MKKENLKAAGKVAEIIVWTGTKYVVGMAFTTVALASIFERKNLKSWSFKDLVDRL